MRHVVLHATAYDSIPSGARARTVGLAAAFLRAGCGVTIISPRGLVLAPLVADEFGGPLPGDAYREIATDLDPRRPWARALRAPRVVERAVPRGADLFVTDYHPVLGGVPTALTIHDLRYIVAPRGEPRTRTAIFRTVIQRLARRAAIVVVPSAAVASEVREHLGVAPERIVVAPNAPGAAWRAARPIEGAGRHLVVVGIAEPRKRFALLVEALRRARRRGTVLPLVAVGRTSRAADDVLRGAADLVAAGALRYAGTPDDGALAELVRDAAALLHPSSYEGFGLPVVESFSCGTPVVAARIAPVEEIAGSLARWVDSPGDGGSDVGDACDDWAEALLEASALGTERSAGREARRARAAEFTWDASAAAILRALAARVR